VVCDNDEIVKAIREVRNKEIGYLAVSKKQCNAGTDATLSCIVRLTQFENRKNS
jgi:hypothetical protein